MVVMARAFNGVQPSDLIVSDSQELYSIIEKEIVPIYYERSGWNTLRLGNDDERVDQEHRTALQFSSDGQGIYPEILSRNHAKLQC